MKRLIFQEQGNIFKVFIYFVFEIKCYKFIVFAVLVEMERSFCSFLFGSLSNSGFINVFQISEKFCLLLEMLYSDWRCEILHVMIFLVVIFSREKVFYDA